MSTHKKTVTVQGGEPPAPVGNVGERAGPTRPSASNCPEKPVSVQAGALERTTGAPGRREGLDPFQKLFGMGAETKEDPFKRRESLQRTPPKSAGSQSRLGEKTASTPGWDSDSSLVVWMPSDEDDEVFKKRKPKRKRIATPDKPIELPELREVREYTELLSKSCKIMKSLVESNPNTKVELKKEIAVIGRTVEALTRKCNKWDTLGRETQSKKIDSPKKVTVNAGTQTISEDEEQEAEQIRVNLEEGRSFEDLAKILDMKWPEKIYQTAKLVRGALMDTAGGKDTALVIDTQVPIDKGFMKAIINIYPEVTNLLGQGMQAGEIECLKSITKTETSREVTEKTKYIYLLPTTIDPGGINDMEQLHQMLVRLREEICRLGRSEVVIATQEGIDMGYARKLIEHAFMGSQVEVTYVVSGGKGAATTKTGTAGKPQNNQEKVLIKRGSASYADLLKTIKGEVDIKALGVEVTQLRKTAAGDLLLAVKGGANQADVLRAEISAKVQGAEVMKRKSEEDICIITGIDEVTTEREIMEELKEATKLQEDSINIHSLRQGKFGNQTALVGLPKEYARRLLQRGYLKIGWLRCRVLERVKLIRCYRCLEFGHRVQDCKGQDRKAECIKCGEEGHRAKDCSGESRCKACNASGHRTDQMSCPIYRKLVKDRRLRLKQKDLTS